MKYVKDLFRISIFVLILYTPLSWLTIKDTFATLDKLQEKETVTKLARVHAAVTSLLSQGRVLEACQRLKADQEAGNVATYLVRSPDADCNYPNGMTSFPPTKINGEVEAFLMNSIPLLFIHDKTFNAEWTFSVVSPEKQSYWQRLKTNPALREGLFKDLLIVIYLIFAFIFCAVLILAKSIQNQYRRQGKDPFWLKFVNATYGKLQLHDMKILKSATSVLIHENETLTKDKDLLETSLEYSILNEVRQNNQKIPYTFRGTVAKVDINGFSKVISSGNSVQSHDLTLFLEDFGCELLQRYEGLFEKTVGDEIIVVFKSKDSALLATAFSRDLMTEFGKIQFEIGSEKRHFTLKGAISNSNLTFSKRAPGYGFHGDALTYSSRLLDMVKEKDRNFLSCMKDEGEQIRPLVHLPSEIKKFEFKNMEAHEGYLIDNFVTVQQIYNENPSLLKYFRSDSAFIFFLQQLQNETDLKKADNLVILLRQVTVRKCDPQLIFTWTETLQKIENKGNTNYDYLIILSKLIMVGINLIPQEQWTPACTDALLKINRQLDGRINSSIIDILIEKTLYSVALENEASFLIKSDQSFRTRGNLLINQAYHQLNNGIFNKVLKMIDSPNPLELGTGVFCACTIILYYQKTNPAALETYSGYRRVIKILKRLYKQDVLSSRLKALAQKTLSHVDHTERWAELV